ncbi:MAG: hypothetical protein NTU81_00940 [Candidatus Nomurabacteria bacterium]|nr:hypothetical protein [Candidatus Nomurabacteria bacterium]
MKASIKNIIVENPSGLLEIKPSLSIAEYQANYGSGFGLKKIFTIYRSKRNYGYGEDRFEFGEKPLDQLFTVKDESEGDLLCVFIIDVIKEDRVHCYLVLTDEAFKGILNDKNQHVLQVHQMYTMFFEDHIKKNMTTC